MKFEVLVLGSNSALPAHGRNPSSQLVNHNDQLYLVDCGEGTQMRLSQYQVKRSRINQIFITHLHGDHIFGLPGLLTSYILNGRSQSLQVFGPIGLKRFIEVTLNLSEINMPYELIITEVDADRHTVIFEDTLLRVSTIPLKHRIPTCGFKFEEINKENHLNPREIGKYQIDIAYFEQLKKGQDIHLPDGRFLNNKLLTHAPSPVRSFAYCSDTAYHPDIVPIIKEVDLLYHEATFSKDMSDQASKRYHSTTHEAALIARDANVKKLAIGHFSSRYVELEFMEKEAKEIFQETYLALEGTVFSL